MFFFFFSMWHLEKHKKRWTRKTKQQKVKPLQAPRTKRKWAQQKRLWQHKSQENARVIMTGQSSTDTTSKKNAPITAPPRNLTAIVMQPILSLVTWRHHVTLWTLSWFELTDGGLFSPLSCDYVNFIPSSARDCGGFDWPWLGCWNLIEWQKKKRFIYIFIYVERERERERTRVWVRGRRRVGGVWGCGEQGRGTGRVGLGVKTGKEEVKTKLKGKIFIQHQTTASI